MRSDKVKVISTNEIIFFTKSIYWKTRLVRMIFAFHSWISTSSVTLINCSGRGWRLWVELWLPSPDLHVEISRKTLPPEFLLRSVGHLLHVLAVNELDPSPTDDELRDVSD